MLNKIYLSIIHSCETFLLMKISCLGIIVEIIQTTKKRKLKNQLMQENYNDFNNR